MQSHNNITDTGTLINAYCREFSNWSLYAGRAVYDETLRRQMQQYEIQFHLRLDFTDQGSEVFVPLVYRSLTGDHIFADAAWERVHEDDTIRVLSTERFYALASAYASPLAITLPDTAPEPCAPPASTSPEPGWYSPQDLAAQKGLTPLLVSLLHGMPAALSMEERALQWFDCYTRHLLPLIATPTTAAPGSSFNYFICVDESGLPSRGKLVPVASTKCSESPAHQVLSHFMPLIAIAGRHGFAGERSLLKALYVHIQTYTAGHTLALLQQLLSQRKIECKGRFFADKNYTVTYPNPLHQYFLLEPILKPVGTGAVFKRYFPKEDITVSIRPFNHDSDMERVYDWFHAEHAKPIWKMDWPMEQLELFYRTITANETAHSFIGEINGEATFNLEVYWVTRDVLGDYYDVLPDDYGTHLLIAPTDKKKKFPSATMQAILDWLFAEPLIGRLVGEGAVESVAALMNKVHVGFRLDKVIDMPHKRSHLNFCYREWYWERFPENKNFTPTQPTHKTVLHESTTSI